MSPSSRRSTRSSGITDRTWGPSPHRPGPRRTPRPSLPLTGKGVVNTIVTELATFDVRKDGLVLTALHPDASVESVKKVTDAPFTVTPNPMPYER